jgi:signal transduction histidine kinase
MTSMLGFTKMIKKRLSEVIFPQVQVTSSKVEKAIQQVYENIDIIMIEGQRLTKLINDVLDITKMEADKMEYKMQLLSIEQVMQRAAQNMQPFFDVPNKKLIVAIEQGLPLIMGDEDRLLQTIINLISNGEKFTTSGSITCQAVRRGQEMVCSIVDTGMGIAQDDMEKIFDKFVQVGDALTNKPQGTGLGLAICRQIIEMHGGQIWAESELGRGSVFFFTLPIQEGM